MRPLRSLCRVSFHSIAGRDLERAVRLLGLDLAPAHCQDMIANHDPKASGSIVNPSPTVGWKAVVVKEIEAHEKFPSLRRVTIKGGM